MSNNWRDVVSYCQLKFLSHKNTPFWPLLFFSDFGHRELVSVQSTVQRTAPQRGHFQGWPSNSEALIKLLNPARARSGPTVCVLKTAHTRYGQQGLGPKLGFPKNTILMKCDEGKEKLRCFHRVG